jgi:hypothetical protein
MIQTEKWTDSGTSLSTGANAFTKKQSDYIFLPFLLCFLKPNNGNRAIGGESEDSWLWLWRNVCGGSVGQLRGGGENLFNQRGRQSVLLALPSGLETQP